MSASPYRTLPMNPEVRDRPSRSFLGPIVGLLMVVLLDVLFGLGRYGIVTSPPSRAALAQPDDTVPSHDVEVPYHLVAYDRVRDPALPRETTAEPPAQSTRRNCNPPYTVDPPTGKKRWRLECL